MYTTKGKKLINKVKREKEREREREREKKGYYHFLHCLIHTQTNKQIHARIGALIVLYNTFLKSAQKKKEEEEEEEEKVNCILIIKATHTQLDVRRYDR